MKKQKAKFFCENCGAEVPADARVCKNCGRFFSSVRCPACGATGSASKFAKGCPVCGYAMDSGTFNIAAYSEEEKEEVRRRLSTAEQKKNKRRLCCIREKTRERSRQRASALGVRRNARRARRRNRGCRTARTVSVCPTAVS